MPVSHGALAPCIEWLFADLEGDLSDRVRAAADLGYQAVEFHLWKDKPMAKIAKALEETRSRVTSFCVDPRRSMVDPREHEELFQAVRDSAEAGKALGSPPMILASGFRVPGMHVTQHHANAIEALKRCAAIAEQAGVMLLLEPLNDRVELPMMYLCSTPEALDIIEAVGSPNLRLLYDTYHSATMGEDVVGVLGDRAHLVHHVQVAEPAGRHEPATSGADWPALLTKLSSLGYRGDIGLEYLPTQPSAQSLAAARAALGF